MYMKEHLIQVIKNTDKNIVLFLRKQRYECSNCKKTKTSSLSKINARTSTMNNQIFKIESESEGKKYE